MQFAVKFESSIFRGPNRKIVGEFRVVCANVRIARILAIVPVGTGNFGKLMQIARISHDLR